jgi:brefeldin A-inhibited guanine nucleotide-exchange protein
VVTHAFELVNTIYRDHFELVLRYGSIGDFTTCLTDFSKVTKFQKISLQAIQMVQGLVPKLLLESPTKSSKAVTQDMSESEDPTPQYWLPVLLSFFDIIMTGEDLEVRRM